MGKVSVKESRRRRRRSMRSLICKFKWTAESRRRSMYLEKRWVESPRLKKDPNRFKKKKHVSEFNCDLAYAELTRKIYGKMTSIVEKEKHVSGLQIQVDASSEKKHSKIEKEKHVSGVQKGNDGSESQIGEVSDINILNDEVPFYFLGRTIISVEHEYAEMALEFYQQRQDAKFKIVQVLFTNRAKLVVPGYEGPGLWCHVSFVAKPRKASCIDASPKHFFGEMLFDRAERKYNVTYCSIFDPNDIRIVYGCIFCPPNQGYLHPVDGCPAGARESGKFMMQKGRNGVSQGQSGGCSKLHQPRPNIFRDEADIKIIMEARKRLELQYATIALEFYQKRKGAEFEIVDVLFASRKVVVVPGSKCGQWWCHVTFTAEPRNADFSTDVSPKYFFGELSCDTTTGTYIASSCEIFEPSDRKITHGCTICPPLEKHPFEGFRVGCSSMVPMNALMQD